MTKVFISYRRADADADAGRIADRLSEALGADNVFHDHQALRAGLPWDVQIDTALADTGVTLVVIGPRWLGAALPDGSRRLDDPKDMVAYEIARSIERGIRIVPLLVGDATLPDAAALPARLQGLPRYQARKLRSDSFGADIDRLIDEITGSRWRRRSVLMAGVASAAVLALGLGGWWALRPTPAAPGLAGPATPAVPAGPEARAGELGLRILLAGPDGAGAGGTADAAQGPQEHRFLLSVNEPVRIAKAELPAPKALAPGRVHVLAEDTLLPGRGERYEADVRRQPLSAALSSAPGLGRTSVCLTRTQSAPASGLRAVVDCVEGERCTSAPDNPGHFEVCGRRVSALDSAVDGAPGWSWIGTAQAQTATPPLPPPAAAAWVMPSIETLRRRRQGGAGPAYTEVLLQSPPLPALAAAREVSVQVAVNGRNALIDGLPPDASAVPFDAATGVRLSFGMENLDLAGANNGHDQVDLVLRFLDGNRLVRETRASLKYIALRDQPDPRPVGDQALQVRWTAKYHPGPAEDRFQVFINSSVDVDALVAAKKAFDAAGFVARVGNAARPLVAVVRPPLGDNRAWGLNVGQVQPSGQVRFTFDDAASAEMCRQVAALAAQGARQVRSDSYRRSVDGTRQVRPCARFSPR